MSVDLATCETFLVYEARLLDDARYEDWLRLFTEDAYYWVPAVWGQDNPHDTISLIYDDRRLLEARVRRLAQSSGHALNPAPRAARLIGNITVEEEDSAADTVILRSSFQMVEYRRDRQRIFAGHCRHRLLGQLGGRFRIAWKRVDLINCDAELDGLSLPF